MPQLRHRPNDRIQNRYEVRKILGSGAFGTVYGCRDLEIDVPVAVKEMHVLDEEGGERDEALAQFRAEATHLSKLRHPHIVSGHYEPVTGDFHICPVCGLDFPHQPRCPDHNAPLLNVPSRHYLVMEYVGGPDLLQLADNNGGKIELDAALRYAKHIASALSHIHARGFVHRDIKPENIRLRSDSEEAVLLDFGIATIGTPESSDDRYGTRAQRHTTGGGTIGYAPEAPHERQNPDARSDIHAFGMTWYHLLTAKDPTLPGDLRLMRTHTPRDFAPEVPDALDALLVECTQFEAVQRPQNGAELLKRLETLHDPPIWAPAAPPEIEPLLFKSGHQARTLQELATLLDEVPAESAQKLYSGELESWLSRIGETELAGKAREFRERYRGRPKQGLEALALATGLLDPPGLEFSSQELQFGNLSPDGGQRTLELRLLNRGRGHLFGLIRASHPAVSTYGEWDGNKAKIPVTFDANRLRPGRYTGELIFDSSAGERILPFEARVLGPSWLSPFLTTFICGALGILAGAVLRVGPFITTQNRPGFRWITQTPQWWPIAPLFGVVFGLTLFVLGTLESLSRRSCSLWISLGLLGLLLSAGAAIFGNEMLRAGDAYLRLYWGRDLGNFAVGAWMLAGGIVGAAWGTIRRGKDLFTIRILAVMLGWLATFILFYAALRGVIAGVK